MLLYLLDVDCIIPLLDFNLVIVVVIISIVLTIVIVLAYGGDCGYGICGNGGNCVNIATALVVVVVGLELVVVVAFLVANNNVTVV